MVFNKYSDYYDVLYKDKDYKAEVEFLKNLLQKYNSSGEDVVSLGCGTAGHEIVLARDGFKVTAVDVSAAMLKKAERKVKKLGLEDRIALRKMDVTKLDIKGKFDIAISMFNVVGYQNTNEDVAGMFSGVSRVLRGKGLFVFDCWHTPAVIKDVPTDRVKKVKDKSSVIVRKTTSKHIPQQNLIEIRFDVIEKSNKKVVNRVSEAHTMRYFSIPELKYFLDIAGMDFVGVYNFLDLERKVTDNNWNIFVVARKR